MKVIKQGATKGKLYRFKCSYCKTELEAEESELSPTWWQHNEMTMRFVCPVCKCNRYVDKGNLAQV